MIVVGLDNAGKTTILYQFLMNEVVHTSPTIGSNVEEIVCKNVHFFMWDIGGQESLRTSWNTYFADSDFVIFVASQIAARNMAAPPPPKDYASESGGGMFDCMVCWGDQGTGEDENGELFHYDPKSKTFLNIRASPVTTAECVAKAEAGAELYVLETQGDWLRVQLKDEDNPSGEMWALRRIVRGNKSRDLLRPGACPSK